MKTRIYTSLVALCLVLVAQMANAQVGDEPRRKQAAGPNNACVTELNRDVKNFTSIDFRGMGKAFIQKGDKFACTVVVRGQLDQTADITTEVKDKVLLIDCNSRNWSANSSVQYIITMPVLEGVEVSGVVKAEIKDGFAPKNLTLSISGAGSLTGNLAADQLQANVSGAGKITLRGTAAELRGSISGTGKVDAQSLAAKRATVDVSGVGSFYVHATDDLTASVSGTGSIKYVGTPAHITKSVSGVGTVKPL